MPCAAEALSNLALPPPLLPHPLSLRALRMLEGTMDLLPEEAL